MRVELRRDGACWIYPSSSAGAPFAPRIAVGLELAGLRDGLARSPSGDRTHTLVRRYADLIMEALPRSGWNLGPAANFAAAKGPIVWASEGATLSSQRLLDRPIGTIEKRGMFSVGRPLPVEPLALPLSPARQAAIAELAGDAWVDTLSGEVRAGWSASTPSRWRRPGARCPSACTMRAASILRTMARPPRDGSSLQSLVPQRDSSARANARRCPR